MLSRVYIYILVKLVFLKNPYLLLTYLSAITNTNYYNYFLKSFFFNKVYNSLFLITNKKYNLYDSTSLIPVELAIKNSVNCEKPVYFLPVNDENEDTNLINKYLNNFEPITNVESLLNNRKFRNVKRSIIKTYSPSLIVCINSYKNLKLISNVKKLGIPSIGLIDKTIINSPFEISIFVPSINQYFQFYYFFLIFKLITYYKKLRIRFLIYNYINFKLTYLKKVLLLK